jgi:hypothetical protein
MTISEKSYLKKIYPPSAGVDIKIYTGTYIHPSSYCFMERVKENGTNKVKWN